jgi:predicted nuclease with RNAse H fold
MIIGVDPGSATGIAVVDCGKLLAHRTVPSVRAIEQIEAFYSVYRFDRAVVEMPKKGVIYQRYEDKMYSKAGMYAVAMGIGQNIERTNRVIARLRELGVMVKEVNPRAKDTKWPEHYWQKIFSWDCGRVPSHHARDASVIALKWENSPEWEAMIQKGVAL